MIITKEIEQLFVANKSYLDTLKKDLIKIKEKYGTDSAITIKLSNQLEHVTKFHDIMISTLMSVDDLVKKQALSIDLHKAVELSFLSSIDIKTSARLLGIPEDAIS